MLQNKLSNINEPSGMKVAVIGKRRLPVSVTGSLPNEFCPLIVAQIRHKVI